MLEGGCFCGKVRYQADGVVFDPCLCHCIDCRHVAGAPFMAWFSVKRRALRFVRGEPRQLASSAHVLRTFCADCGTPLTYQHDETPENIDISTASLDHPESVPPEDHVWTAEKLPWISIDDGLPQHRDGRPDA